MPSRKKPTVEARLVQIEETLVQLVQDTERLPADLVGYPLDGSPYEWLGEWLAMKSEEVPKLKIGWGSERVNRRAKR